MTPLVVGAFGLSSPEFLIPLVTRVMGGDEPVVVLLSYFTSSANTETTLRQQTTSRYFSLPLPLLNGSLLAHPDQVSTSIRASDSDQLAAAITRWGRRTAALIRLKGDRLLAQQICAHTHLLRDKVLSPHSMCSGGEVEALNRLLTEVYTLTITSPPPIQVIKRGISLPCGNETEDGIAARMILDSAKSDPPGVRYKGRGFLRVGFAGGEYLVLSVREESLGRYTLVTPALPELVIESKGGKTRLLRAHSNGWKSIRGVLAPYGVLTLFRSACVGRTAHVPWYARFARNTDYHEFYLPARETISPVFPIQKRRASSLAGGGLRVVPGGACLLDFRADAVRRYCSALLQTPVSEGSALLFTSIAACAYGRCRLRRSRITHATQVSIQFSFLFGFAVERSDGLRILEDEGETPEQLTKILWVTTYLLRELRKCSHRNASKQLKRKFIRNLCRYGWLVDRGFQLHRLLCQLDSLLPKVEHFFNRYGICYATPMSQAKEALNALRYAAEPVIGLAGLERSERVQMKDDWRAYTQLIRALDGVGATIVASIWAASETLFATNLWNLFLCLGPHGCVPEIRNLVGRRVRPYIDGRIPIEKG